MGKYDPLFEHLCAAGDQPVQMSFLEIEDLVGPLPASAVKHAAWWSNDHDGRHVQARAWLEAGREVRVVDRERRLVSFSAIGRPGS